MKTAVLLALCVGASSCGPDEIGRSTGSTGNGGKHDLAGSDPDLSMSLSTDLATGPDKPDACASVSAMATLTKKPVDIIFIIDTSGSMSDEIISVEKNINMNFANIIGMSGLDYRVIMLAEFGPGGGAALNVCIKPPLGGNTCTTETAPVNTAKFFHYDQYIDSNNSLDLILSTYNKADPHGLAPMGWSKWLRADALKVFIEITDDKENTLNAVNFDTMLTALTPKMFGTTTMRNYIWHSITGFKANNPVTKAWAPTDPVQTTTCGTDAVDAGQQYQELSRMTGGLRFPICQYSNFDVVFNAVATGVVAGSKVACNFDVPSAPFGQLVDLNSVVVNFTPSTGGGTQAFTKVDDLSKCAPGSFYLTVDADSGANQIVLCPDACTTVQADDKAQLGVLFDCSVS